MRKRIFLGAILCLILASVLAIALLRLPIGVVEPARSEPIRIGVLPYPGFAPFYIAESEGFFEQEGVVVEIVTIADPTQAISLIASGQVQMLFSSADFTPVIVDSGVDVKEILATDIGFGSDGLLVTEDIQKISDLKGETAL